MGKLLALKTAPANRAALIDEAGDLGRKIAAWKATGIERRDKQIAEEMATWYTDAAADQDFTEKGLRYTLSVSPRANQTSINIRAAYKILGLAKFLTACTLTLKALKQHLSEPEVLALTSSDRTGHRTYGLTPIIGPVTETVAPISGGEVSDRLLEAA